MERVRLTNERINDFICPTEKRQAFLWDTEAPGLAVRATTGAKSFIFESKLDRKTIRITLGDVRVWVLNSVWSGKGANKVEIQRGAREESTRLKTIVDQGKDPHQVAADEVAAVQCKRNEQAAAVLSVEVENRRNQITVGEAWAKYIANPPKKNGKTWGERHMIDHEKLMLPERIKGEGATAHTLAAGALAALAPLPLSALTAERVGAWLAEETQHRPTQASLAFRLLRAFVNWCDERDEYKGIAAADSCARKVSSEHLRTSKPKDDSVRREQLKPWFAAVRKIANPTISTYLQGLLITGARRNELSGLRWSEVDFQNKSLTIRDKVEGERTIPLTPYLASLLRMLQRKNEAAPTVRRLAALNEQGRAWAPSPWVFSSVTSATGRLEEPSIAHRKAVAIAGLPPVSLHGLRRSFASLSEWCEVPAGVVAQLMGHKPSAIAEKHYIRRPLDLLEMWHVKIEAWILSEAGVSFLPVSSVLSVVESSKGVMTA